MVTIDEVVRGVCRLEDRFEFRDIHGVLVDWAKMGVWRAPEGYWTSTPTGKRPVWLHLVGEPVPPLVLGKLQHEEANNYWSNLFELYEDVK